jgi:hypothetical protein
MNQLNRCRRGLRVRQPVQPGLRRCSTRGRAAARASRSGARTSHQLLPAELRARSPPTTAGGATRPAPTSTSPCPCSSTSRRHRPRLLPPVSSLVVAGPAAFPHLIVRITCKAQTARAAILSFRPAARPLRVKPWSSQVFFF